MKTKVISLVIEETFFILYLLLIGWLIPDLFPSLSELLIFAGVIAGAIAVCKLVEVLIMPPVKRKKPGIGKYELGGYFLFWGTFFLDYSLLDYLGFRCSMSLLVLLSLISAVWQMAISHVLDRLVEIDWKNLKESLRYHEEDAEDE